MRSYFVVQNEDAGKNQGCPPWPVTFQAETNPQKSGGALGRGSNNQNGNLRWFLPLGIEPPHIGTNFQTFVYTYFLSFATVSYKYAMDFTLPKYQF